MLQMYFNYASNISMFYSLRMKSELVDRTEGNN